MEEEYLLFLIQTLVTTMFLSLVPSFYNLVLEGFLLAVRELSE